MQKNFKLQLVTIALSLLLVLSGCGMIPVAGLLVDDQQPSIFLVNSGNYPRIEDELAKKIPIAKNPEQADFLVYIRPSKRSLLLDIIAKKGKIFTTEYQLTTGNDQAVIATSVARIVRAMPWLSRNKQIQPEVSI